MTTRLTSDEFWSDDEDDPCVYCVLWEESDDEDDASVAPLIRPGVVATRMRRLPHAACAESVEEYGRIHRQMRGGRQL